MALSFFLGSEFRKVPYLPHIWCLKHSILSVAEARDRAPSFFYRNLNSLRRSPVADCLPEVVDCGFIVNRAGINPATPRS